MPRRASQRKARIATFTLIFAVSVVFLAFQHHPTLFSGFPKPSANGRRTTRLASTLDPRTLHARRTQTVDSNGPKQPQEEPDTARPSGVSLEEAAEVATPDAGADEGAGGRATTTFSSALEQATKAILDTTDDETDDKVSPTPRTHVPNYVESVAPLKPSHSADNRDKDDDDDSKYFSPKYYGGDDEDDARGDLFSGVLGALQRLTSHMRGGQDDEYTALKSNNPAESPFGALLHHPSLVGHPFLPTTQQIPQIPQFPQHNQQQQPRRVAPNIVTAVDPRSRASIPVVVAADDSATRPHSDRGNANYPYVMNDG